MSVDRPYDHSTVKKMLYGLHIETQRLSEYASLADGIHKLASEGKVSPLICHDLLMTIGNMTQRARADAKVLKLATLRRMESFIDPSPRKRAAMDSRISRTKAKTREGNFRLIHQRIRAENLLKTSSIRIEDPRKSYIRIYGSA